MHRPVMLLIRDGWGIGQDHPGNAVQAAKTPVMDRLLATRPVATLQASGLGVGLREGAQGSSEVGHLNMGAGRIVKQEVVRVDEAIASGALFESPLLVKAIESCKGGGARLHLMGLVQDQGVHATDDHLFALLEHCGKQGVDEIFVHFFGDGRDTAPRSALTFLDRLEKKIAEFGVGRVASVMGRYWSMDRGKNWDRTKKAYDALVHGTGLTSSSARAAIEEAYARADAQKKKGGTAGDPPESDEFIQPTLIAGDDGAPIGTIRDGDAVLHFNYRQDRAIQLTMAFAEPGFAEFDRGRMPDIRYMGLTRYYDEFEHALIPPMNMSDLLGEVLSTRGLRQLRIAEYQKFRHVTSFFNGKRVAALPLEDRIEFDSISIPEDQKPEMSAYEVAESVLKGIAGGTAAVQEHSCGLDNAHCGFDTEAEQKTDPALYDFIALNFANCDMVGHTGVFEAAVKAVETVDECVGKVVDAILAVGGIVMVTADHGNAEQMIDPETGGVQTAHTTSPVEFVLVTPEGVDLELRENGILSDIAPTILELLDVPIPEAMTAQSLIAH